MSRLTVEEARGEPHLRGISLLVRQGEFVGVGGPPGCGKSSLLLALLDEMPRTKGRVVVRGSLAYCAQTPWVQAASLRENVLFGRPFEPRLYERVLAVCAVTPEMGKLPNGDRTEIGEGGVRVSPSFKMRVGLARACYQQAAVYLLDDVLAAVDAPTASHLLSACIGGFLRERGCAVLLASRQTRHLAGCAHVVILNENGSAAAQGKPAAVLKLASGSSSRPSSGPASPSGPASTAAADVRAAEPPPVPHPAEGEAGPAGQPSSSASAAASSSAAQQSAAGVGGGSGVAAPHSILRRPSPLAPASAAASSAPPSAIASGSAALAPSSPRSARSPARRAERRERSGPGAYAVWLSYARALGGGSIAWLAALYTVSQVLSLGSSYWLARWTDEAHAAADRWFYVYVYAGITLGAAALVWVRVLFVACSSLRVGRRLHDRGLRAVVASPMSFFDATPLSRVLAGFGADLQVRIEIAAHL